MGFAQAGLSPRRNSSCVTRVDLLEGPRSVVYSVSHWALWHDLFSELFATKQAWLSTGKSEQGADVKAKVGRRVERSLCQIGSDKRFSALYSKTGITVFDLEYHHKMTTPPQSPTSTHFFAAIYLPQRRRLCRSCSYPFSRRSQWPPSR